jgi:hypothetical protein
LPSGASSVSGNCRGGLNLGHVIANEVEHHIGRHSLKRGAHGGRVFAVGPDGPVAGRHCRAPPAQDQDFVPKLMEQRRALRRDIAGAPDEKNLHAGYRFQETTFIVRWAQLAGSVI